VCDPYLTTATQPTVFELIVDGGTPINSPAQVMTDGSKRLYYDVGYIASGNHTIGVKACVDDLTWGRSCSASVPFTFTRPGGPAAPANFGLIK